MEAQTGSNARKPRSLSPCALEPPRRRALVLGGPPIGRRPRPSSRVTRAASPRPPTVPLSPAPLPRPPPPGRCGMALPDTSSLDRDGDGKLSGGEIKEAFAEIDKDHDGVVTRQELRSRFADEEVQAILDSGDQDGDGKLNIEEFTHVMTLFNAPDSTMVNIMQDLAHSRRMAERNNKARMDQIDRIRKKLEKAGCSRRAHSQIDGPIFHHNYHMQEKADFADELQRMRRDAQQKVFANMDDIRDKMHSLRNSQSEDNTQMEEKIRMVREELEKMKASITSVTERRGGRTH
ncbi:unnamed protein product [Prorocentrum cordatum]|uniref:EF-hand domain-containing protein n=1 Tax=Prorocentrum cordatum TaxID=2364126 RepID=A0ABN9RZW2_9DINO|nr:unnamed protein product [Polarella glacialis]